MPDVLSVGLGGGSRVEQSQVSTLLVLKTCYFFYWFLTIVFKIINSIKSSKKFFIDVLFIKKKMNE